MSHNISLTGNMICASAQARATPEKEDSHQPPRCQIANRWVPKFSTHFFFPVVYSSVRAYYCFLLLVYWQEIFWFVSTFFSFCWQSNSSVSLRTFISNDHRQLLFCRVRFWIFNRYFSGSLIFRTSFSDGETRVKWPFVFQHSLECARRVRKHNLHEANSHSQGAPAWFFLVPKLLNFRG